MIKYWEKHNIAHRINWASTTKLNQQHLRSTLNSIDNDITTSFLLAKKYTRRRERPPWSPELREASLRVKLLKLTFRQFSQKQSLSIAIQNTKAKLEKHNNIPQPSSKQECQTLLRRAQKHLQKIRQQAHEKRAKFLEESIQYYNTIGEHNKEKIIKSIKRAEATKRCYRKLRWILHPPKPGVTFVQRTSTNGTTETL